MAIKLKLGRKEDFVNLLEFLLYFMMATFSYFLIYSGNRCAEIFNCDHFPKLFFICTKFSKEKDGDEKRKVKTLQEFDLFAPTTSSNKGKSSGKMSDIFEDESILQQLNKRKDKLRYIH